MSLNKKLSEAIGINKNEKNVKLTEAPTIRKNDTGHFNVFAKFAVVQADLIYITEDKRGYKYILNVVDVASRALDAIPLRGRTAEDVIEGFEKIFNLSKFNSCVSIIGVNCDLIEMIFCTSGANKICCA